MALIVKDRVKESTTTTGTADFTLNGAASGFQTFAVIGNSNTTYYAAVDQATGDWEVGVGTYSSTGPTLTRDTVLESSNSGSKVNFAAGSKEVFCTYPAERSVYLDAAGSAVTVLDIGTLGVSTANITTANITAGTVTTTPSSGNDLVNKTYVDTLVATGIHFHQPVRVESPINLNATYNNGAAGVGATLTNAGTQVALVIDGITMVVADRVLVYEQTNQTQNGVYVVTSIGSGSTNWVLTRADDADTFGIAGPDTLSEGSTFFVQEGATGAGETYTCNTPGTITFGTTNITFAQISSAQIYSAGTGLTLTGTQFSITNTGTAGTYGSASSVPVFVTNAQGQVTSVTPTAIAITSAAVSGLAPSATTDTTDASNISSGTLPSARLNGSYTGITGVGTLAAGTWNASTIAAIYGGTGQSSYAVGDLLYASTTTALSKLADVVTGNALISGGVGTAPAWGKIGLTTHVSGTLAVGNGGTGTTTAQGAMNAFAGAVTSGQYLRGNGTNVVMSAIQVADVPTLNQNTTGTAAISTAATITTSATASAFKVPFANTTASTTGNYGLLQDSTATFTYNPSTNTLTVGTVSGALSGNASTATDATNASLILVSPSSTSASYRVPFTDTTGTVSENVGLSIDTGSFTYNPSTNTLTVGTVSGALSGNATTATTLQTARTINGVSFNGSANITVEDATKVPLAGGTMTGDLTVPNLVVNTTLSVRGAIDLADSDILRFGSSDDWELFHNGTANYMDLNVGDLIIRDNATTRFTFGRTTGNLTATGNITANSDERLKTDWANLPVDFLERLARVKSGTYTRIDNGVRQAGTSAQDWQKLLPEVVSVGEDDQGTLSLGYGNAALVSAVELAKRVVDQEARIAKLEARVAQLIKGNAS